MGNDDSSSGRALADDLGKIVAIIRPLYELIVIIPSVSCLVKPLPPRIPHLFPFLNAVLGLFVVIMQFFAISCRVSPPCPSKGPSYKKRTPFPCEKVCIVRKRYVSLFRQGTATLNPSSVKGWNASGCRGSARIVLGESASIMAAQTPSAPKSLSRCRS